MSFHHLHTPRPTDGIGIAVSRCEIRMQEVRRAALMPTADTTGAHDREMRKYRAHRARSGCLCVGSMLRKCQPIDIASEAARCVVRATSCWAAIRASHRAEQDRRLRDRRQAGTVEDTIDMVCKVKPEVRVLDTTIPDHSGSRWLHRSPPHLCSRAQRTRDLPGEPVRDLSELRTSRPVSGHSGHGSM